MFIKKLTIVSFILYMGFLLTLSANDKDRFIREGDFVYDKQWKLVWQDDLLVKQTKLNLEDAINHCNLLKHLGLKNWRLPTPEELWSITDYDPYRPTLNPNFKTYHTGHYWSIETTKKPFGKHWSMKDVTRFEYVWFSDQVSYENDRTLKGWVRCVHSKNI